MSLTKKVQIQILRDVLASCLNPTLKDLQIAIIKYKARKELSV